MANVTRLQLDAACRRAAEAKKRAEATGDHIRRTQARIRQARAARLRGLR